MSDSCRYFRFWFRFCLRHYWLRHWCHAISCADTPWCHAIIDAFRFRDIIAIILLFDSYDAISTLPHYYSLLRFRHWWFSPLIRHASFSPLPLRYALPLFSLAMPLWCFSPLSFRHYAITLSIFTWYFIIIAFDAIAMFAATPFRRCRRRRAITPLLPLRFRYISFRFHWCFRLIIFAIIFITPYAMPLRHYWLAGY